MFDFPLGFAIADVFCRGESPAKLAAVLTNDRRYPDATQLVTLVDNHDLPRLMSVCGGDLEKAKAALSFLFGMRGVPSIAWGTEVGFAGAKEPENRASMRFEAHPLRAHVAEAMQRRRASAALREGVAIPSEVRDDRVVFLRATSGGEAVELVVTRTGVEVRPAPRVDPARVAHWQRGDDRVELTFSGSGALVGSGPELGDWTLAKARPLPVTLALPRSGVFEFKLVRDGRFEDGPNRLLHVVGPAQVAVAPRD